MTRPARLWLGVAVALTAVVIVIAATGTGAVLLLSGPLGVCIGLCLSQALISMTSDG